MKDFKKFIRNVPDFPKKGIVFRDITTLLKDKVAYRQVIETLYDHYKNRSVDVVVGIEARGFLLASSLAYKLGVGVVPVRKPGKLPAETLRVEYELEYGTDALEIHRDAIEKGQKVLIVDDLLATGGTVAATCQMVEKVGGEIVGIAFLIELDFLRGRKKLNGYELLSLIHYDSE
ncbi:MAG: adenine phosphoribosyltransferase [candidate division Zixibacteria bacterium SM23_81]|nr:MAG: adenine phosphoribosyltransferase [candidate division Zixibacteria bacterium SM23_81]